jgi:hypothetical protein
MDVNGGSVNVSGDMTVDAGAIIANGTLTISQWATGQATLTLGINPNSPWSELIGGNLVLQGTLVAHGGGFYMDGGNLSTAGATYGNIVLDTGSTFEMYAGEIDVTDPSGGSALGYFILQGNFFTSGGKIVDNVDTRQGQVHGFFSVSGNATLSTDTIFSSVDINQNANNENQDWWLMHVGGTLQGDFTYILPPNWTNKGWKQGDLTVHEP